MSAIERVRHILNDGPSPWCGEYVASDDMIAVVVAAAQPDPAPIRTEFHVITIAISAPTQEEGADLSNRVMDIKRAYSVVLTEFERVMPFGTRERASAITNLQQSCFWAVDAIIRHQIATWAADAKVSASEKLGAP